MIQTFSKNLSILFVGTLPPHPGGSAIANFQLLVGCAKLGHRIRSLAPITAEALQSGDAFAAAHSNIGVRRYLVPSFESFPNIPASDDYRRLEGKQIQEMLPVLITRERPDIIVIGRETFAWHVPDIAEAHSLPCILIIHGATTIGMLTGTYPEALTQRLLEQYRKIALIVTPAKHMANSLQQLGVGNIKVIPNAVDLRKFSPKPKNEALLQKLAIRDNDIIVFHASNMKTLKRPLDIVSSAEGALQHNPKLVYVIVGDGPCRGTMEKVCRYKNISDKFRFVGWVDYDCMPDYINLADIVVMPSEAETQALVYLETQACGRLILASDIPGAREVIVDGETGLLFRTGDINDLTVKTLLAAGDSELRANIGHKARERVQAHSMSDTVAAYVATLEEVI